MESNATNQEILQELRSLRMEVKELKTELAWRDKIWLNAEEACQVLGLNRSGVHATEPLRSLEHRIKVQYTRPKLYRSKDVFKMLDQIDNGEIALQYHGRRLVIVPLKNSSTGKKNMGVQ